MRRLLLVALLLLSAAPAYAALPADAIPSPDDFKIWWDSPNRAYPGIPLDHHWTYYETDNRLLTWAVTVQGGGALPAGMTFDQFGRLSWPNPTCAGAPPCTYDLNVTVDRLGCNTVRYPGCTTQRSYNFTLSVNTTDFIFVSTTGNDTNAGTSPAAPFEHILKGLQAITSNDGKTIYLRGGTYNERWFWFDQNQPSYTGVTPGATTGKNFTATDYLEIRSYPGEAAILNSTGSYNTILGHGFFFWADDQYVVVSNVEAKNATTQGNFYNSASHAIFKDVYSHGANYSGLNNVTGVQMLGCDDCVLARATSHSNHYVSGGAGVGVLENQSNVMTLQESGDTGEVIWVLDTKSWDSYSGFWIKHANGAGRTIFHNTETFGLLDPASPCFFGSETNASFRYGVCYGHGITQGRTDPSAYTTGGMLFEHNTVYSAATTSAAFIIQSGTYASVSADYLRHNIFYQENGAAGTDRLMMHLWRNTTPLVDVQARPFDSNYNLLHNTAGLNVSFIVGSNGISPTVYNFAQYQALTGARDTDSTTNSPQFVNAGAGNLNIGSTSAAALNCGAGEYCGAFMPTRTMTTVGVQNRTLLVFDGNGAASTTTTTTTTTLPLSFGRLFTYGKSIP